MNGRVASALFVAAVLAGCNSSTTPAPDAGTPDAGPDAGPVAGIIQELQIVSTYPAYDGGTFGTVGQYTVISGIVHGKLNPNHPANAGIVDLGLAPVDSDGMVEYTTDFVILRPTAVTNAKRILFYDVNNRGNQLAQGFINNGLPGFAPGAQGDALLLRLGYTLVWSGWQGNVAQTGHGDTMAIGTSFPVATYTDGGTITGVVFDEEIFDGATTPVGAGAVAPPSAPNTAREQTAALPEQLKPRSSSLDAAGTVTFKLTYPAATTDQSTVNFNWRETYVTPQGQTFTSPSTPIPTSAWSYVDNQHVSFNLTGLGDMGAIYNFTYTAMNPIVMGIGFAAVRDFVSFLRNGTADAMGNANPLNDFKSAPCQLASGCSSSPTNNFDVAIMEGVSQSGRFVRDFLWQGFNDDTTGHKVFEGMMPIIPASRKTWTNYRWAQPGRFSKQHEDHFQRGDQFPFGYAVTTDPVSGVTDGIFGMCTTNNTCPLIVHVDGAYETWGGRDMLLTTDGQGNAVSVPDTVRIYDVPGTNHGGGSGVGTQTQPAICLNLASPINERPTNRALVVALEAWLTQGTPPPSSRFPSVTNGTAADPTNQAAVGFPDLSGMGVTYGGNTYNQLFVTDYSTGIPVVDLTKPYQVLVSVTDADGNDVAGVRTPDFVAPIATYTAWNLRAPNYAPGDACYIYGSMIPFAKTPATRLAGDPRRALSERYTSHADYVNQVTAAANDLVAQGLLLQEDVAFYVNAAEAADIP
ncbi:MAG: alpha/beta hydrolase domain-containing protein [Myxococcaceae bacterium]